MKAAAPHGISHHELMFPPVSPTCSQISTASSTMSILQYPMNSYHHAAYSASIRPIINSAQYGRNQLLMSLKYHTTVPPAGWMQYPQYIGAHADCRKSLINGIMNMHRRPDHRPDPPMRTQTRAAASTTGKLEQQQQAMAVDRVELPQGLDADRLPRHVSVIMDGNARWAQMQGVERPEGHAAGVRALMKLIFLSSEWGISAFSVFLFSTENWKRSQDEVSALMEIYEKSLIEHLPNFLKYNIKVKVIGDKEQLPQSFQNTIFEIEKKTGQNTGLKAAFAINYGGRLDIMQAFQEVAKKLQQGRIKLEDVSEKAIDNELWTSWMDDTQAPDLLIRTSGEQRISNFFLWQAAYSEIMFLDVCFPAFSQAIYSKALVDFQKRDRRYGKRQPVQLEK